MADGSAAQRLTRGRLYEEVWKRPLGKVGQSLGLSANGVAKICDRLLIPYPSRGHWQKARAGRAPERPPLEGDAAEAIVVGARRSPSRRKRTRMDADARREQLLDAAAQIVMRQGVRSASTKAVAREVGISEAQAHNYFQGADLLIALARREVGIMNEARRVEFERGGDATTRVALSTLAYLRQASGRGRLVRLLLSTPEVRAALKAERDDNRRHEEQRVADVVQAPAGMRGDAVDRALTRVLTAVCLRTGRLVAERRLPLEVAERLCLAVVLRGHRDAARARYIREAAASLSPFAAP